VIEAPHRWSPVLVVAVSVAVAAGDAGRVSAQTSFVPVGSIPGPASWIEVQGRHAYIAAEGAFSIFDIADPAAPKHLGTHTFPERIWGFTIVGSHVYVAADFYGLGILDVSNPAEPRLQGAFKTPGQAKGVALVGDTALITDHMSGLDIVDVSSPATPTSKGSYFLEGYARDVVTAGSLAYAVDSPTGLYIFDLSKPGPVEPLSVLQSSNPDRASPLHPNIELPAGSAQPTIACVVRSQSLHVYDVSNPAKPVSAATVPTPSGRPQRVSLEGTLAYVADAHEGLVVVDLSTPSKPRIVGTYKTNEAARDVAVAGSLVFLVTGELRRDSRSPAGREVLILRRAD
jgi:hypothetical protein